MEAHPPSLSEKEPVRAIVLAAGSGTLARAPDDIPLLLHPLAGKAIVEYVIENALHFVTPQETYVVVGYQRERIQQHIERVFGRGFTLSSKARRWARGTPSCRPSPTWATLRATS